MPQIVGEYVDQLITVEMRPLGVPRGIIRGLYQRVRDKVGAPLTLRAAQRLERLPRGATVFLATGAGASQVLPKGETDGPLGTAALARILARSLEARPVILTTTGYEDPQRAALDAYETSAEILTLAADADSSTAAAVVHQWLDHHRPCAVIAVEMKGAGKDGKLHFMTGRECTVDARLDQVLPLAEARGLLTLGIGDGGNEIGFGRFVEDVEAMHPDGATIACTIPTDEIVVAAISNWGCYGVEAMLAFCFGHPELLHGAEMGVRAMEACAAAGAGDGIHTRQLALEDGQPGAVHVALLTMLRQVITNGLLTVEHSLRLRNDEGQ